MANRCRSPPSCRKWRKAHHTLLHIEKSDLAKETTPTETASIVMYVPPQKRNKEVLLMTCRAEITGPGGISTQARVFLDPGGSCSFITKGPAQQLRLLRWKNNARIAGIAGVNTRRARGIVIFTVGHVQVCGGGKKIMSMTPSCFCESPWTCQLAKSNPLTRGNICQDWTYQIQTSERPHELTYC